MSFIHCCSVVVSVDGVAVVNKDKCKAMIDELLDATEKFGRNADWDEYLRNVPEVLCHYYNDKRDIENLKKYAAIAKRLKK